MEMPYRPYHRKQLWRPVTGPYDCGPRSWQHAIDHARRSPHVPGVDVLRDEDHGNRPGAQGTNVYDADRAFAALGLRYQRVTGQLEWSEVWKALRRGDGVHLCISYGVLRALAPGRSGSRTFTGGHSIYVQELRRRRNNGVRVTLSFDSLYDGRYEGIPDSERFVRISVLRRAAQAFAGAEYRWWGGIVPVVDGAVRLADDDDYQDPDEQPIDPDSAVEEGDPFPEGSSGDDIGSGDPDDDDDDGDDLEPPDEPLDPPDDEGE